MPISGGRGAGYRRPRARSGGFTEAIPPIGRFSDCLVGALRCSYDSKYAFGVLASLRPRLWQAKGDPMDAIAYFNRALAWKKKGDYSKASRDYDEARRRSM